ncbi:hypothetical protein BTO15_11390 [Polaribacter sejongensis]|uniref:Nucleoside phosphorylase domain-containing protein n=1 Tax=Polaribacter sejongensis TaxID=985043 RepID=A0ABN5F582_9FLAO|nr:hypothetical protein [Polaribacter sejongensis]AUC22653.1 hypothetical protein BTO15_11390 [Polaribacter sejongensis]
MIIHQAFYGEVNRGHACINQSLINSDLTSFLISFTDRPAALPPGVALQAYFSGTAWSNYYIFTKTFTDPYATRSGMVFTHALIINLDSINSINNLNDIFCNFIEIVPESREVLNDVEFNLSPQVVSSNNKLHPLYIKDCISTLLVGKLPILFTGDEQSFENIIQQIWNAPNIELRKKIRYRASFSPSDIEGVKDLTIVSVQKDLHSKWLHKTIIDAENNKLIKITSHSEALFLGSKDKNPFYTFLIDLNVDQSNFSNYGQLDKVFGDYNKITTIDNADIIRQNIRMLSIVSPSMNDGATIKNKFIDRLNELIKLGIEKNFKALRNINWKAFENGENGMCKVFSEFIKLEFINPNIDISNLSELIDLGFYETKKNWWHDTIKDTLKSVFTTCSISTIEVLWKLVNQTDKIIENIFQILPKSLECESFLRDTLPAEIKESTIKKLENISKQRKWLLLHADILLKYLEPKEAIIKQLKIETDLTIENSFGGLYLIGKLNDKQLLSITLSSCNTKLIHETANRISKNKSLLNNIDPKKVCWLNIWSASLILSRNFSYGIEGREIEIVKSIFDLITSNESVPDIIIESISESEFADISNYGRRDECWNKISPIYIQSFIEKTSKEVITQYIKGKISFHSIEEPLVNYISSDIFMSSFLSAYRDNIEPVIRVYESFPNLKDLFLANYIKCFSSSVNEAASINLGSLVYRLDYTNTAKNIYDKSRYNYSFKAAFEQCKSLVSVTRWDSLWNKKYPENSLESGFSKTKYQTELEMIKSLPTVVILTAIQEEYKAVRAHLIEIDDVVQNDTVYEAGIFKIHDKEIAKVVIRECGAKNTIAAQETERAIQYFTPNILLFVGIAGSRKPNDFSIGDVIFPKVIYSYEAGKSEKGSFLARPDLASSTYTLMELAKRERRKDDWKSLIKNDWNIEVKADLGIIASGEQIVEHYESEVGKILTKHYNDTSAVEMEGFGFAKVATRQGRETSNMLVGVIRGISDIIEQPNKNKGDDISDRRPDNAKKLACDTSAAFAYWLIYKSQE